MDDSHPGIGTPAGPEIGWSAPQPSAWTAAPTAAAGAGHRATPAASAGPASRR